MLQTYTAQSLENEKLTPPQMVVDGLLPIGLSTLAGSPKLGKSWLALSLCCSVAEQKPFLGRQTYEGSVLYLDLEGSPYRMKERLETLGLGFPRWLTVAHKAPQLGNGLIEELEWWYGCCDAIPRLVVIDTITKVRADGKHRENEYNRDSQMYAPLQEFALKNEIAVVCITHLKKNLNYVGADADWLERISGSMGLSGISDNIWGLFRKRGENTAYLRTTSRDIDAGDMVLKFENGLWTFVSNDLDEFEFKNKPLIQFLSEKENFFGTAAQLCSEYVAFCDKHGFPHGLSDTQPATSLGRQIRQIKGELWRINRSISVSRTKEGTTYRINTIT